jgi:hypothetical protein
VSHERRIPNLELREKLAEFAILGPIDEVRALWQYHEQRQEHHLHRPTISIPDWRYGATFIAGEHPC